MPDLELRIPGSASSSKISIGPFEAGKAFSGSAPAAIIADSLVLRVFGSLLPPGPRIEVPRGESAKSLETLEAVWDSFLELGLDRSSMVLAVGGGATSDLAGLASSTWMRGLPFEYAPTTLLAMVDASVGGKTGIDFRGRKNLVGTFSQPRRVHCDVAFLDSLDELQFASGMAEAIKHAVLAGGAYAAFVEGLGGVRPRASTASGRAALEALVLGSIEIKAGIVSRDERESGERRLLNLGHSIGHALEAILGIPHGHAVAAGLASEARLGIILGHGDRPTLDRLLGLLSAWKLPDSISAAFALSGKPDDGQGRDLAGEALAADKKRDGGELRIPFPAGASAGFGACIERRITLGELMTQLKSLP
ncbi:MAG: 3-dehydroquinate synthase family protein [Spirochaetota bacterium]